MTLERLPSWVQTLAIVANVALIGLVWRTEVSSREAQDSRIVKLEGRADVADAVKILAQSMETLRAQVEINMRDIASIRGKQDERTRVFEEIKEDLRDLRARMPR